MADWGAVTGAVAFRDGEAFLRLTPAKAPAPSPAPAPRPSWDNNKRDDENIMRAIVAKEIKVHDTRVPMTAADLRVAMNNIQRSLKMTVQMQGKWSPEATACLIKMLGRPKRRRTASGSNALADKEPERNILEQNAPADGSDGKGHEPENHDNMNADNVPEDPENTKDNVDDEDREQNTDSDTSEKKKRRKKQSSSSSSSISSSSSLSYQTIKCINKTNIASWPSDWADAWTSAQYLVKESRENQQKKRIAYKVLMSLKKYKAEWDSA